MHVLHQDGPGVKQLMFHLVFQIFCVREIIITKEEKREREKKKKEKIKKKGGEKREERKKERRKEAIREKSRKKIKNMVPIAIMNAKLSGFFNKLKIHFKYVFCFFPFLRDSVLRDL